MIDSESRMRAPAPQSAMAPVKPALTMTAAVKMPGARPRPAMTSMAPTNPVASINGTKRKTTATKVETAQAETAKAETEMPVATPHGIKMSDVRMAMARMATAKLATTKIADDGTAEPIVDPACGMSLSVADVKASKFRATYNGHNFVFCSEKCKKKFESDPGKYAGEKAQSPSSTQAGIGAP